MPKYQLGERVRYSAYMRRLDDKDGKKWTRISVLAEGIIVGKRTVNDGYSKGIYDEDGSYSVWWPTKYHSFWLVAHNLTGYRYVAEADIESVEVAKEGGIDGYEWSKIGEDDNTEKRRDS